MRSYSFQRETSANEINGAAGLARRSILHNTARAGTVLAQSTAATNQLLRMLPSAVLKRLEPHLKRVNFSGGEFVYRPDEQIEWIIFPETSAVSELQILEDGRTIEVALTGHESAVGLPALFSPGRASTWIQACAPGSALRIKRDVLRREIRPVDRANTLFHEAIQNYVRQIAQKAACNAHHSVEQRFSTWLLMLHDRCPWKQLRLTQEQIARVLGVYRPSVTCIAQEMREAGLIEYVRGNIVIVNREALRERSCDCYDDLASRVVELWVVKGFQEQPQRYVI
jgi:CRP-like cAMP-binding protein